MTKPVEPRSGVVKVSPSKTPVWKVSPANGQYYINSVAVSAEGDRVIGGTFYSTYGATASSRRADMAGFLGAPSADSDNGTFGTYAYNASGQLLWKNEFSGWRGVYWVAVSADGSKAASGGLMAQSPQAGFVRAFDGATGAVLLDQATQQRVNQVALSVDGAWLVSAAETLILFQFHAPSGAYVQAAVFTPTPSNVSTSPNAVVSAGISADGSTIVFSDYLGNVGVLTNTAGVLAVRRQWKMAVSFCHMVALTTDGKFFAAGGAAGCFYLNDTARFITDGKPTYTYDTGLADPVYGVAVAENGRVFAGVVNSGADAGFVYVAEIVDFAAGLQVKFPTARNPNSASLHLDTGLLAVADGHPDATPGHFYLYEGITDTGLPIIAPGVAWEYTTGNMSWPVKISANGQVVVGGSDDSNVYYFTV